MVGSVGKHFRDDKLKVGMSSELSKPKHTWYNDDASFLVLSGFSVKDYIFLFTEYNITVFIIVM